MSLYELQRNGLVDLLKRHDSGRRHLIVDDTTEPIVKDLLKEDVLNYVYTFYKIDDEARSANREHAIYLLDPVSRYSVECLRADWAEGKRYQDAVLCFLPGLDKSVYDVLKSNQFLTEATGGLKIERVEFLSLRPTEHRVYVSGGTCSVPVYYNFARYGQDLLHYQMDTAVNAMMSMCLLTNEYPTVRYYNSDLSRELAKRFQRRLDDYYRANSQLAPISSKTVFLVTDRAMDLFGPFCHYKSYRAQIFDMMDADVKSIRGDYTYVYDYDVRTGEGMERKHLVFDVDDPVYTELKNLDVDDYTKRMVAMLDKLRKEDAKYSNLEYASDLTHAALTQGEHMLNKQLVTGHFQLVSRINQQFQKEQLLDLVVFENKCAGNMGPLKTLHEPVTDELLELLASQDVFLGNKIRLLIVYAAYRGGLVDADLDKLLLFGIPRDKMGSVKKLVKNMQYLGLNLVKKDLSHKPQRKPTFFAVKDVPELTERMVPTYTNLARRLAQRRLPELYNTMTTDQDYYKTQDNVDEADKTFPYVKGSPVDELEDGMQGLQMKKSVGGVRNAPKWKSTKALDGQLTRQKLMVFCAGGLTQSEIATLAALEPEVNKNIFIGTDEVYTTWDLIGDIRLMSDEDRAEFKFPLDTKLAQRPVPAYLAANSRDPNAPLQPPPQQQTQHHHHRLHSSHSSSHSSPTQPAEKHKHHKLMRKLKGFAK